MKYESHKAYVISYYRLCAVQCNWTLAIVSKTNEYLTLMTITKISWIETKNEWINLIQEKLLYNITRSDKTSLLNIRQFMHFNSQLRLSKGAALKWKRRWVKNRRKRKTKDISTSNVACQCKWLSVGSFYYLFLYFATPK